MNLYLKFSSIDTSKNLQNYKIRINKKSHTFFQILKIVKKI